MEILIYNEKRTWLHEQGFINKGWVSVYIHTFYWAVSTMVTILLYIPETDTEQIFSILAMFICAGCFGYALSTIGNIITDLNKKTSSSRYERERLNRFIIKYKISDSLKDRL